VISNLGTIVSPFSEIAESDTAASLEYAVILQGARRIIVCGHSSCTVLQNLLSPSQDLDVNVNKWLDQAPPRSCTDERGNADALRELVERNVILQMQHLMTYRKLREE
jgi:carbonic anhydrase